MSRSGGARLAATARRAAHKLRSAGTVCATCREPYQFLTDRDGNVAAVCACRVQAVERRPPTDGERLAPRRELVLRRRRRP
jgi:hypothetical protein